MAVIHIVLFVIAVTLILSGVIALFISANKGTIEKDTSRNTYGLREFQLENKIGAVLTNRR